jgi:hypothetical protein
MYEDLVDKMYDQNHNTNLTTTKNSFENNDENQQNKRINTSEMNTSIKIKYENVDITTISEFD